MNTFWGDKADVLEKEVQKHIEEVGEREAMSKGLQQSEAWKGLHLAYWTHHASFKSGTEPKEEIALPSNTKVSIPNEDNPNKMKIRS